MRAKVFPPLPPRLLALINEALAGVIRRRRERHHLKPAQLAARAGLSRQTIGYVEDDRRHLSLRALEQVAAGFGLTGSELALEAEFWLRRLPAGCQKCHNCDIHRGELVCFNRHRECLRNRRRAAP